MNYVRKPVFAVLGGDRRISAAAEFLKNDGYEVKRFAGAADNAVSLESALKNADTVILPIPMTKDGITLYAPFYGEEVKLSDIFLLSAEMNVFAGLSSKYPEYPATDYYRSEELKILNALPTAEGALQIAMHCTDFTVCGSKCLVAGFGRIGKILASKLRNLGAEVTVSARKSEDLAWIEALGYRPVLTSEIGKYAADKNIFFNTVPSIIFDTEVLRKTDKKTIILDIASAPGGVDTESAEKMNIRVIQLPGLPGRTAPQTAGKYIKQTVLNLLKQY